MMTNKPSLNKLIKNKVKEILYYNFKWYKGKYLGIHLKGGLCNKLMCLISACDIAIKEQSNIIEPYFGWEKKILFSDIYDLDHFNSYMNEFTHRKPLIISKEKKDAEVSKRKSIDNIVDLWEYSEKELTAQRKSQVVNENSTKLHVLRALKLRPEFEKIVETHVSTKKFTAIQIRTESDWVRYAQSNEIGGQEKILVPLNEILKMISEFDFKGDLFFTSGQNHNLITEGIKKLGITSFHYYNPNLEYEINAAINFEICCKSERFIGLSRSSFSNLISLKRASILKNDQSYIYNYGNKIMRRVDKGIQFAAEKSINCKTTIC